MLEVWTWGVVCKTMETPGPWERVYLSLLTLNGRWDAYVPVKQFWIIALLGQYSIVSHVFSRAASFTNTVSTSRKVGELRRGT